jgi:hypothetical protein
MSYGFHRRNYFARDCTKHCPRQGHFLLSDDCSDQDGGKIGWIVALAVTGLAIWYFKVYTQAATLKLRRDPMLTSTQMIFLTVLLVVLPYGTAITCGAITQWAGRTVSGWCSLGGLALGICFFHKSMELFLTG